MLCPTSIITEPISVRIKPEFLRAKLNSDVSFECKVYGHPLDTKYWVHDGRIVKPNERIKLSEDGLRLHIKNVQRDDQGIYQCFANNVRDQGYGTAEFLVDGKFQKY